MGTTHYWQLHAAIAPEQWAQVAAVSRRLIQSRAELLSHDGESSQHPVVDSERIEFNGRGVQARETFELRRVPAEPGEWVFCKTDGLPYDEVVTAVLIVLKLYVGESVLLRSDTDWRNGWAPGRRRVEEQLGDLGERLAAVEADLRPRPGEGEFTRSLNTLLRLPQHTVAAISPDLLAEAHRRLGVDLASAGFFLMPRDMAVTHRADGTSELAVDLLAPHDVFTHPARIAWREGPGGTLSAWWLELPESELATFFDRLHRGEGTP